MVRLVSGCQILLLDFDSIGLVGRPVAQRRVGTALVVEVDPATDAGSGLCAGLEGVQEHAFVFERAPQPFDKHLVHPASGTVHRDAYARVRQCAGEGVAGELMGWTAPRAASNVPGWSLSKPI